MNKIIYENGNISSIDDLTEIDDIEEVISTWKYDGFYLKEGWYSLENEDGETISKYYLEEDVNAPEEE